MVSSDSVTFIIHPSNKFTQSDNDDDELDIKDEFEAEAEEDDDSFIDDDEPDESDSDAEKMTRETCAALRNRKNWKETTTDCPLCADLRMVLKYLLKK